jgi:hypothetical protein
MPHLEYCVTVWGKSSDVDRITKFKKRAARVILNKGIDTPSTELFASLKGIPHMGSLFFFSLYGEGL